MIDLKNEKRDIYDYFDLIDQAKNKKGKGRVYRRGSSFRTEQFAIIAYEKREESEKTSRVSCGFGKYRFYRQ